MTEELMAACCHLLRAIGVDDAVCVSESIDFMAQEIEAMSPSEPVLSRLYRAALKAAVLQEVS